MKTALVTGYRGFIGSHMAKRLESDGYMVAGVDTASPFPLDAVEFFRAINEPFDLAVHCAYVVGGRATIDGNPAVLSKNLALDAALFDYVERTKPGKVIYYSSSAVYPVHIQDGEEFYRRPLCEDDADHESFEDPDANYGFAKLVGERQAFQARQRGHDITVLRPFSGYGPGQSMDYPFPSILTRVRSQQSPLEVWGSSKQVRDWIYIDDLIEASLVIAEASPNGPVNLCTGIGTSMEDLATVMWDACNNAHDVEVTELTDKPMGVMYRVGDPTLMHEYYTPRVELYEGIERCLTSA